MKSAAYVLDVDDVRYVFQVFEEIEPKFDEVLIEKNIRAGKYVPGIIDAPTPINWILNSGEYMRAYQDWWKREFESNKRCLDCDVVVYEDDNVRLRNKDGSFHICT